MRLCCGVRQLTIYTAVHDDHRASSNSGKAKSLRFQNVEGIVFSGSGGHNALGLVLTAT
jgi:hypothetical protein